jgi:hypothetical protein
MAIIIHRCACGHPDFFHHPTAGSCEECPCTTRTTATASELLPTWDGAANPVTAITPPGAKWHGGGRPVVTCSCTSCTTLHQELVST